MLSSAAFPEQIIRIQEAYNSIQKHCVLYCVLISLKLPGSLYFVLDIPNSCELYSFFLVLEMHRILVLFLLLLLFNHGINWKPWFSEVSSRMLCSFLSIAFWICSSLSDLFQLHMQGASGLKNSVSCNLWSACMSSCWDYLLSHQPLGRADHADVPSHTVLSWSAIKCSFALLPIVWELAISCSNWSLFDYRAVVLCFFVESR